MELTQTIGILGSIILIIGAALPDRATSHPALLRKNQFLAVGSTCMFAYAVLNYFDGGSFFFILLQILITVSTVLMLLNTNDRIDVPVLACAGAGLAFYSLSLFEGDATLVFVAGLVILGIGFALKTGTSRRNLALAVGSTIIALFSYLQSDWIFFGLNVFFALFSGYHAWKLQNTVKH